MFLFFNFYLYFKENFLTAKHVWSRDLQETNKQTKQVVYLLPRIGMLSYWPDICHSQIHTKNELPHRAHGERHCSTQ